MLKQLKIKIFAYRFFDKFMFIYPFYMIMFEDFKINPARIAFLMIIWKVSTFLFEYPSGILADKYSRKIQLIIAQVLMSTGFVVWILNKTFVGFSTGFILWGMYSSLKSGTFEAFLFDKLKSQNRSTEFKKVFARSKTFQYLGILIAGALSTFFYNLGSYNFVLTASILSLVLSVIPILLISESKIYQKTGETEEFSLLKRNLLELKSNQILLGLVLIIIIVEAVGLPIEEFTNLLVVDSGLDKQYLGIFGLLLQLFTILGAEIARFLKSMSNKISILIFAIDGLLWLAAAYFSNWLSLGLILFDSFLIEIFFITFEDDLQKSIPSHIRASVSSLKALFSRIVTSIFFFGFGIIANKLDLQKGFYFLVTIMWGYSIFIYFYFKKRNLLDN